MEAAKIGLEISCKNLVIKTTGWYNLFKSDEWLVGLGGLHHFYNSILQCIYQNFLKQIHTIHIVKLGDPTATARTGTAHWILIYIKHGLPDNDLQLKHVAKYQKRICYLCQMYYIWLWAAYSYRV
jgi:hypothetical protein